MGPPYCTRRGAVGEAMYAHLAIPRTDKAERHPWLRSQRMRFCETAIGHEDAAAPIDGLRGARADRGEWLRVIG